ncbi:ATP-dependent nuclease [Sphingobacterium siyangense]|uniref:ATP-dependent nuclease n=1 Tax=Sphingobacterium siyangense TaxID=459529 RepID=UPI003DA48CB7
MHISKLIIKGFRSYDPIGVDLNISESLAAFIGINSSGKSSAIDALRKLFGNSPYEKELVREDFHISPDEEAMDSKILCIEVSLNFEEDEEDAIAHYFSHMVIDVEGGKPYIRIRLEGNWTKSDVLESGVIESKLYFIKVAYGEDEEEESKVNCPNHLKSLIQIIYVPAIRNPSEQLRYSAGSIFHRVLRKIQWSEDFKDTFADKIEEINAMFEGINEFKTISKSINTFWKKFHNDKRYEEAELGFTSSDYEATLKKLEVSFDPSGLHRPYKVGDLGEGYRSIFYITLVCALLDVEEEIRKKSDETVTTGPLLTILALEEPENHIAPQLLGRVVNNLYKISEKQQSQVIISSHTPSIIKRVKPEAIYHFRVHPSLYKTIVSRVKLPKKSDEAYKYVKEAVHNYPEIYFAKLVVIGEGDSEEILFNKLSSAFNTNFDDNVITFAPLGHRFVNHIWRLLKQLDIPYITLLDLDIGREGGGWGRIKYAIDQLIVLGEDKNTLLETDGGILSDQDFLGMLEWSLKSEEDYKNIRKWCKFLTKYNLYYSKPLDLDWLLFNYFKQSYLGTIPTNGGPRIPDKETDTENFNLKVYTAVKATLKSEKAIGEFYSESQKEQMIYYNYLFLGRGKPSTHIQALASLDNEEILNNTPPLFKSIFNKILKILELPHEDN